MSITPAEESGELDSDSDIAANMVRATKVEFPRIPIQLVIFVPNVIYSRAIEMI